MDHLRQVKVLEVKPVDDSEGKYVRKLSKKAEKLIREKLIMECKPEYSKLADILDKREKKEKGNEEKQPWGLLYWLQCKQMLIIHELTMHMHFAY